MPALAAVVPRAEENLGETTKEFRMQWHNPREVTAVLLIIGGEIVQKALAQLSGPSFVPVAFSFGWVAYAFSSIVNLVGDCRLMPEPDYRCKVINVTSGFDRENRSWVIGRLLRDSVPVLDKQSLCVEVFTTRSTRKQNPQHKAGVPETGASWFLGLGVMVVQLAVAAIPCILYNDWGILMITAAGTMLALSTGVLPQWKAEKYACREKTGKIIVISAGNGSRYAMVILGKGRGLDLEDLASGEGPRMKRLWDKHGLFSQKRTASLQNPTRSAGPQNASRAEVVRKNSNGNLRDDVILNSEDSERELSKEEQEAAPKTIYTVSELMGLPLDLWFTRIICLLLTIAWTALLVFVAALEENAWFLLAVGAIGMVQNAILAGMPRESSKRGIHLKRVWKEDTGKAMDVIMDIESAYPGKNIGHALREEFFPGPLTRSPEISWWNGSDKSLYETKRVGERAKRGLPYSKRQQKDDPFSQTTPEGGQLDSRPEITALNTNTVD